MAPKQHLHFALCRLIDDMRLVVACLIGDTSERKYGEFRRFYFSKDLGGSLSQESSRVSVQAQINGNNKQVETGYNQTT